MASKNGALAGSSVDRALFPSAGISTLRIEGRVSLGEALHIPPDPSAPF
jgi:hypothetical protein